MWQVYVCGGRSVGSQNPQVGAGHRKWQVCVGWGGAQVQGTAGRWVGLWPPGGHTCLPCPQSTEGLTAIIVVFSILGALIVIVLLVLLVRKLREKRQTEGTYRPSVEEQVGARAPPPPNLKLPPEERLI